MDRARAIEILEALANGFNPLSGELLPSDGVYGEGEVIRALCLGVTVLKDNEGSRWTIQEEESLRHGFEAGMGTKELAKAHGRTHGAIRSRLVLMGLIERAVKD